MTLNLDLLESQHLPARLKLLEYLDRLSPYRSSGERFDRRLAEAMRGIPEEWTMPALAVFGTTLYMTAQQKNAAWRYMWSEVRAKHPQLQELLTSALILELDRDTLRDEFYRGAEIPGRLHDNLPIRSAPDMIDELASLESGEIKPEYEEAFFEAIGRPFWILLSDVSLSGSSLCSEMERLNKLAKLIREHNPPQLICLLQLGSESATVAFENAGIAYIVAMRVPESCALNNDQYSLVTDPGLVSDMRDFCRWFAETHVISSGDRLATSLTQAAFGFGEKGWSVVTCNNSPNNSLPPLWFSSGTAYRAPFERVDSRIPGPSWQGRKKWEKELFQDPGLRGRIRELVAEGTRSE